MNQKKFEIAIIGGGPAGSTAAIFLSELGFDVCLIEKKKFPREVLCGEFLSMEVIEIVKELNLYEEFLKLNPNYIKTFKLINVNGSEISSELDFPAFGLKRSAFDNLLLNTARIKNVQIYQPWQVDEIFYHDNYFKLNCSSQNNDKIELTSKYVIAAYGKQNILDKKLNRSFLNFRSNLNGVKYHLDKKYFKRFNKDEIKIITGESIYCGLNEVNENIITVCFLENRNKHKLSPRKNLIKLISDTEKFKDLFEYGFEEPLLNSQIYGTGNIYFGKRNLVENGIFMIGDAAGVIAPLVGDGIGIAMQSAKIIAEILEKRKNEQLSLIESHELYMLRWNELFARRMKTAALIQKFIMANISRNFSIQIAKTFPTILPYLIRSTRA